MLVEMMVRRVEVKCVYMGVNVEGVRGRKCVLSLA